MAADRPTTPRYHRISFVTGDVTPDGATIELRVQTEHHATIGLALPTVDLQHLVTLLLLLGGKAALNGQFAATSETFWTRPLPLHGVSLGVDDKEAILTVEVGASILSFALTARTMADLGRTIMTLTDQQAAPQSQH